MSEADYDLPSRPGVDDVPADWAPTAPGTSATGPERERLRSTVSRWPERTARGRSSRPGTPLTVTIDIRSHSGGTFPLTPSVVVYRLDGTRVTAHVGPAQELELEVGDRRSISLRFDSLNLGDGRYVLSAALHRRLEQVGGLGDV